MSDADVRAAERYWQSQDSASEGLGKYIGVLARSGARDVVARDLGDVLLDNSRVGAHGVARVLFRQYLGDCWVDDSNESFWEIPYFTGDGQFVVDRLKKSVECDGEFRTQAQWNEHFEGSGYSLQGLPEYVGLAGVVCGARRNPLLASRVEGICGVLEAALKGHQMLGSRTVTTPGDAPDRFYAHDGGEGTPLALAGPRGLLRALPDMAAKSKVLFGTVDVSSVADTLGWIGNHKDSYVWRFNEQEKANLGAEEERVVGLVVGGIDVDIDLGVVGSVDVGGSALGWSRRCGQKISPQEVEVRQ